MKKIHKILIMNNFYLIDKYIITILENKTYAYFWTGPLDVYSFNEMFPSEAAR